MHPTRLRLRTIIGSVATSTRGCAALITLLALILGAELRQIAGAGGGGFFGTAARTSRAAGGAGHRTDTTAHSTSPAIQAAGEGPDGGSPAGAPGGGRSGKRGGSPAAPERSDGGGSTTGARSGDGSGGDTTSGESQPLLRWAPPALTDPITIRLPPTGNVRLDLKTTRDYVIKYPDIRRVGGLTVRGGRNIVIIGGASTLPPHPWKGLRNLQLKDRPGELPGRIIHIEGLDFDGSGGGEGDGIGISTPSAIVQIENVRITGLIGHLHSTHADVIQTWGGVRRLQVYNLTGASHYNSLYLRRENSPLGPPNGRVILDHVNVFGYVNPPGWDERTTLRGLSIGTQPADTSCDGHGHCGPANPDDPTNCAMAGSITLNHYYAQPPSGPLDAWVWPTNRMAGAGCAAAPAPDAAGIAWPALSGAVKGMVQLGPPPGGDFVPAGSVGVGYQSPGYR